MSHATDAAIGMMDGAYFTSRNDILNFLNSLLNLNLTKIEQTASGAVACQLTEYIFPGSVPMSRVNWAAKSSFEYVDNYKLLQKAFNKRKIQKHVDVDKLIRGKYQDNLEFCQWLKAFFDQTAPMMRGGRESYDPVAVRAKGKGGKAVPTSSKGGGGVKKAAGARAVGSARAAGSARAGRSTVASSTSSGSARSASAASAISSRPNSSSSSTSSRVSASKENTANSRGLTVQSSSRKVGVSSSSASASTIASNFAAKKYEDEIQLLRSSNTSLKSKYTELEAAAAELEVSLQTVESERDFYFEKLRGIEVMLQVYKEREEAVEGSGEVSRVMDSIFKVMYATMDDDVVVDDEGNLVGDVVAESSVERSVAVQDDLGNAEREELLTSGFDEDIAVDGQNDFRPEREQPLVAMHQFSSDSDDLDDDELLTSGLDDDEPAVTKVVGLATVLHDNDDLSDEDLLAD